MTGVAKDTINDHVISRKLGMEKLPLRSFGTTDEYEVRFLTSYETGSNPESLVVSRCRVLH